MRSLIFFCASLFFSLSTFATNVSGGIYSNTTWTATNNPYIVTGDIVVFDDFTLTIEPGVQVLLAGNYKIEVRGKLRAIGNATNIIEFKPETSTTADNFWTGIKFVGNTFAFQNQCIMEYCYLSNAYKGLDMDIAYHGPYIYKNCTFTNNHYVNYDGGGGTGGTQFDYCKFISNKFGVDYFQFGGKVSNCLFDGNIYIGARGCDTVINCTFINHPDIALQAPGYTANCELYNNNTAVRQGSSTFINNKVHDNTVGVEIPGCWANDQNNVFTGNEICNNSQYDLMLTSPNNCNIANNCWCTTDSATIRSKIFDGYSDISKGLLTFMPVAQGCNAGVVTSIAQTQASSFEIFPNPVQSNSSFNIQTVDTIKPEVYLFDLSGKRMSIDVTSKDQHTWAVKLGDVKPGLYFISLKMHAGKTNVKKIEIF